MNAQNYCYTLSQTQPHVFVVDVYGVSIAHIIPLDIDRYLMDVDAETRKNLMFKLIK